MATLLYRLGRFSFRRPWRVLAVWLILLAGILGGGLALNGHTSESFSIPGTESQQAIDRLDAVFPAASGASAQVVLQAPKGTNITADAYKQPIARLVKDIGDVKGVRTAQSPFDKYASDAVSKDESTGVISVQFTHDSGGVTQKSLDQITALAPIAKDAGLKIAFGGQVFQSTTVGISPTEGLGLLFAGVVLFVAFGSLLAAGMPLLTAITGIGVAMGGVIAVSAFTDISSSTPLLALMIGLAVGIDYALFILSRHRNQLANGVDPEESAATAVATAGSSVVFAGLTVIIALLGLLVVRIPFLSAMGISAAGAVLLAILVSVTLLPALLGFAGKRLVPKPGSRAHARATSHETGKRSLGQRWVGLVLKAPLVAVIGVISILGTLAIPAFSLTLALPDGSSQAKGTNARDAYDLIAEGFGPGRNGPLIILTDITQTTDVQKGLDGIRNEIKGLADVSSVSQGLPNQSFDTAIIQVTPKSGPDAPATSQLVGRIRALEGQIDKKYDMKIAVTGSTAVQIDISNRLNNALVPFGLVVVGLSILLLMMVFRSVFVPIKAAIGFLLSVFASFGVVVAVFQWGWFSDALGIVPGPILSFMPILLMAVLFGLAMDYEVFLVSGMRESWVHTRDAKRSIITGFSGAARVVTAAALIMFFVFASFIPDGAGVIKVIALGLAVGILADAFLVRMTLVPAAMALMGKAAWWMPKWLSAILPNVDIEGERLREHRDAVDWASAECSNEVITADALIVGSDLSRVGPLNIRVPAGALVIATGSIADRRLFSATVAGRLDPVSGRLQVGGHPLPSESGAVTRLVALEDVGGSDRAEVRVSIADLLIERIRLTGAWYRGFGARHRARTWLERADAALGASTNGGVAQIAPRTTIEQLPQLQRAVALAAVALSEQTPIVVLDLLDAFGDARDEAAFLGALDRLAPEATTVVVALPASSRMLDAATISRRLVSVDLERPHAKHADATSTLSIGTETNGALQ
jgi:RND superfamily putative drug exporter